MSTARLPKQLLRFFQRTWRKHAADLAAVEEGGGEAGALGVVQTVQVWLWAGGGVSGRQRCFI